MKTVEDQGIKNAEALKSLKLEKNKADIKSFEGFFPKEMKINEINNELMKLKNGKKKLNEETQYIKQININMTLYNMKQ